MPSNPKQSPLDAKQLDQILTQMVDTVNTSKDEIFEIGEQSRAEYEQLSKELIEVRMQVEQTIQSYDQLENKGRLARGRLAEVSKNFQQYSEGEIRSAYEAANEIQVELSIVNEKENQLKRRRDDIERRLIALKKTVDRAESLVGQVSVVQNYLNGDLKKVGELVEDARQKQAFGFKIIEAQEEERKRLSREIHDGPAQLLAHVLLGSEIIERVHKEQGPDASTKEIRKFREMLRNALYDVRRIIYDLRPMTLDDLGLVPTLKKYLKRLEEQFPDIEIQFRCLGDEERLPSRMEAALFRLVQEAVQNACKHANPNYIQVSMEYREDAVILLIKDDGIGFEICQQRQKENTFGLIGMQERVDVLEGKMDVQSKKNNGTLIIFKIPILEEGN